MLLEYFIGKWIVADQPALVLAPMDGVTDKHMRAFFSERGGFTYFVSEFLRVNHDLLPPRVFYAHLPELESGSVTPSGDPVQLQILGGNAEVMALTAERAVQLGAQAIDINFGCPAPTVNRHDGGATLLKFPERIEGIVKAVREILPLSIPVSVKMRLGWDNYQDIFENAERAQKGGASWITIHARNRMQGYAPPVDWKLVGQVRGRLSIPVVANGDIFTREDFFRCREESGCIHFMIGRGALADPTLPLFIAKELGLTSMEAPAAMGILPGDWRPLVERFIHLADPDVLPMQIVTRTKQWIRIANTRTPLPWFNELKQTKSIAEVQASLRSRPLA